MVFSDNVGFDGAGSIPVLEDTNDIGFQAVDVRDPLIVPIKTFPFFDPVRSDPRYRAILRRMNLSED